MEDGDSNEWENSDRFSEEEEEDTQDTQDKKVKRTTLEGIQSDYVIILDLCFACLLAGARSVNMQT